MPLPSSLQRPLHYASAASAVDLVAWLLAQGAAPLMVATRMLNSGLAVLARATAGHHRRSADGV